ncbi:hypothetical protein [Kitasatospora terrestris]|uniref:Glycosyltransferase RgtA/B/C/D-like domain-containing protein n=1 Tax=Kitasatospora terrestris TaxID=258051 RepID=A0ABP9DM35_9ACTN
MTATIDQPTGLPVRSRRHARTVPPRWRLPLAVAVFAEVVLLLWWAAVYPGLSSYDSAMYVLQVTTGDWASDHSVLYDALVWCALHLPGRLAVLTLGQTVLASATLAYTCVALRALGVRGRWTAAVAILLAAAPPTGAFVLFIWKDVPFTLCAVLVFAASARLVARRAGRPDWWVLGVSLAAMGLFRNNGLGMALVAGVFLVVAVRGRRLLLSVLTVVAVSLSLVCQLYLYPALGIRQPSVVSVHSLHYHDLAVAYAGDPAAFRDSDRAVLAAVMPLDRWSNDGTNCYVGDQLFHDASFDQTAAGRLDDRLIGIWKRVLKERPDLIADAHICRGHIAWAPFPGPKALNGYTWIGSPGPTPDDLYGLAQPGWEMSRNPYKAALLTDPLSTRLNHAARAWYNASKTRQLDWLLFRGATWAYLGYAALWLFARGRRMRPVLALAGVTAGYQLSILVANPAPLYRYMVGPMFIGAFCLTLLTARREGQRAEPKG